MEQPWYQIKVFNSNRKEKKFETPDFGPSGPDDNAIEAMNMDNFYCDSYNQAIAEMHEAIDKNLWYCCLKERL